MYPTDERFTTMFEDLCVEAWNNVGLKENDITIAAAHDDQLHTMQISSAAFNEEDGFDLEGWNESLTIALSDLPLWFAGLAMPFIVTPESGKEYPMVAVAGMDRIQITIAAIRTKRVGKKIVPVCWEPTTLFHPLDILVPVIRRHVTQQG